jgi:hypothetical protein
MLGLITRDVLKSDRRVRFEMTNTEEDICDYCSYKEKLCDYCFYKKRRFPSYSGN